MEGNLPLFFLCFTLYLTALFSSTSPWWLIFRGAIYVFFVTGLPGLLIKGAYFRNFTVAQFNEPLHNGVLNITNNIPHPSNGEIYGKEPGYNKTPFVILRFHCTYFGSIIINMVCSLLQCDYCTWGHLDKIDQSARITGK